MFSKHLGWQTERGREWKPWKGQRRQSSVLIMSRSFIHRPDIAWRMKGRKTKSFSEAWVMLIVQTSSYLLFLLVCFTWSGFGTRLSQGLFLRYWRSSHLNGHMLGKHPTTYTYLFPIWGRGAGVQSKAALLWGRVSQSCPVWSWASCPLAWSLQGCHHSHCNRSCFFSDQLIRWTLH